MCGVVSITYPECNSRLGSVACDLLKRLEYRGYDSTGGAFIEEDDSVTLLKKVGAPSIVTEELKMSEREGKTFIGQVRWATFGSVTDENAQPHVVNCLEYVTGAHNGNITNTDSLKEYLQENNHKVISDNDGEMLTHMVEHFYNKLNAGEPGLEAVSLVINAIRLAQEKIQGSYAACLAFRGVPGVFAMKAGSSLYAGKGEDEAGNFIVVSSDLTSVLSKTRFLIPLSEGEGLYFTDSGYKVFSLYSEEEHKPELKRSKLNIGDISLNPGYQYYMEQEIDSSVSNIRNMMLYYLEEESEKEIYQLFEKKISAIREILLQVMRLNSFYEPEKLEKGFRSIINFEGFKDLMAETGNCRDHNILAADKTGFTSEEAVLLTELLKIDDGFYRPLVLIDNLVKWKKKRTVISSRNKFLKLLKQAGTEGSRIFIVASGTSLNAGLTAAYFLNKQAGISIIPANPGTFRSLYLDSLVKGDILIGISQSGETKDLVNIYNAVEGIYGNSVRRLSVVNNENSTIPQEKSEFYLPILCGPEIAVAATKSFINQIGLFYMLALSLKEDPLQLRIKMDDLCRYMESTLRQVSGPVENVAERLFMEPSIHILGTSLLGLAKEGALKIREIVINHTEGCDSAEFKHGPNTILGKNMCFSFLEMERIQKDLLDYFRSAPAESEEPFDQSAFLKRYFSNYPLVFLCPPDLQDIRTTIAQIHTHKIRGADIFLIAEENEELRKAVEGRPANLEEYHSTYIELPSTGDSSLFIFNGALTLQLLALKMSIAKRKYLNRYHIENHGVHPDVPKNVSKSITVD